MSYKTMQEEYLALQTNHTWDLVLPTAPVKIVGSKWVSRIKYNSDGSVSRYKDMLVAKEFHQKHEIHYTETFSPVVKASTVRVILSLAVLNQWVVRQAPRVWFDRFKAAMISKWHFQHSRSDNSLFYNWSSGHLTLVLVYVDDIIITGSSPLLIQQEEQPIDESNYEQPKEETMSHVEEGAERNESQKSTRIRKPPGWLKDYVV
ncbi:hypothetical protein WN943_019939 [Citrus x changshan-huyou]